MDHSNLHYLPIHQKTQHHNKTPFRCKRALVNCQSVTKKTQNIQLEIAENNLGICALTKTWIKVGDDIKPLNYVHQDTKPYQYHGKTELEEDLQLFTKNP